MADLAEKRQAQLAKQNTGGKPPAKIKKPVEPPTATAPARKYYPLPELKDNCGACGKPLHYIPVNSRVRAVACINKACKLYREWIRTVALTEVK